MVTRALQMIHQFICGLHGHDALLHFETGRLSMRCTSCGHETPGWEIKAAPARREAEGQKGRVLRLPLVHQRRVA
jgi:hypothetical protein